MDEYGRITNKLDQAGAEVFRYTYDANSRLLSRWAAGFSSGTTYYTNDAIGNLTYINYPAGSGVSFAYDPLNRLTNMVDAVGTTRYTYTAGNQVLTEDGPFPSDTITNSYVNRLRTKLVLQQPSGLWTNVFNWDVGLRITNVISPAGSFIYAFAPGGVTHHPSRVSLPNTSYITNNFDVNARLLDTSLKTSSNSVLDSYAYLYDPANQRTNLTRTDSTVRFSYDKIGQLTVAASSVPAENRGYFYDVAWNLNRRTNNSTTENFTVDNKNQLTNAPDPANNQLYDDGGNLIASHNLNWIYYYDDDHRLVELIRTNSPDDVTLTDFVYDGLGRLKMRLEYIPLSGTRPNSPNSPGSDWDLISETHYIYDGWRVIQERDGSNTPLVSYTRGSDLSGTLEGAGGIGGLLARSHGYSGTDGSWITNNYYFADGSGNITYLVDSSQTLAASYRYDPFGNLISSSGTLANANLYRFSSKEIHAASGTYYFGYRFYDPSAQRWLNRDPIGERGGFNLYDYAANDPLSETDPYGLWAKVTVEGNKVSLTIPIYFDGPGASAAAIQDATRGIQKAWTGDFGKYNVTAKVEVVAQQPHPGARVNIVHIALDTGKALTNQEEGDWFQSTCSSFAGWEAAHEAGHLMGLRDKYQDELPNKPAMPEWEGNIMGSREGKVDERNIDTIIRNPTKHNTVTTKP